MRLAGLLLALWMPLLAAGCTYHNHSNDALYDWDVFRYNAINRAAGAPQLPRDNDDDYVAPASFGSCEGSDLANFSCK